MMPIATLHLCSRRGSEQSDDSVHSKPAPIIRYITEQRLEGRPRAASGKRRRHIDLHTVQWVGRANDRTISQRHTTRITSCLTVGSDSPHSRGVTPLLRAVCCVQRARRLDSSKAVEYISPDVRPLSVVRSDPHLIHYYCRYYSAGELLILTSLSHG